MIRRLTIIGILVMLWSGCSSSSFVGRRVDNFTAYYNTFYNARKAYKTGYESIERKDDPIDINRYLPLFVRPSGNTANREFDSAVVKSADILRDHDESKWVDDALLLIGKSYFYQENIVGALQKFREVIDRKTDLEDEARFWLARTLIVSRSFDEADNFLQESLARENIPRKWIASYKLALGELFVQRSDWAAAAEALAGGLEEAKDKELSGRAQFLLGQVYENMDQPEDAVAAYERVRRFNPLFELDFASRLSAVRVDGLFLDPVRALKDLRKLERDDKYFGYIDELRFMRGRIIQAQGFADDAYNAYFDLLYDENRLIPLESVLRGRIHYAMGELYRDLDNDYMRAAAHFDTASVSLTTPTTAGAIGPGQQLFTRAAITDAREIKANFNRYASVYGGIAVMDSLLWLGTMGDEEFDAKILALRLDRARLLEEQRKARAARLLEQQFRQSSDSRDPFLTRGLPEGKIIPTKADPTGTQSGFLFHRDPERVEDGRSSFLLLWGDRPLVENWRRIEAVRGAPVDEIIGESEEEVAFDPDDPATLPEIDTSAVPRDSLSQEDMKRQRAISWLDLGNALFLALNMPDSAAVWYRKVIDEDPDELVVQRSYYALAEVQKTLGDSLSTERLYEQIVVQYPESEYAVRIREQRGEQIEETEVDSSALALEYYEMISSEWLEGRADDMLNQAVLLAATFPGTEAGAKALLAGGEYHLEEAGADKSKVLRALSIQLPDSLLMKLWPEKYGIEPAADLLEVSDSTAALPDSTVLSDSLMIAADLVEKVDSLVSEEGQTEIVNPPSPVNPGFLEAVRRDSLVVSPEDSLTGEIDIFEPTDSVDVMMHVDVDSLGISSIAALPDSSQMQSISDSLAYDAVHGDSLIAGELTPQPEEEVFTRPEFFVEDLFDLVLSTYGQSPYAPRALALRTAVDELRNPPQVIPPVASIDDADADSIGQGVGGRSPGEVAQLAQIAASMNAGGFLAALDSTALSSFEIPPVLAEDSPLRAPTDSLAQNMVEVDDIDGPVKSSSTETDEESVVRNSGDQRWVMLEKYPEIEPDSTEAEPEFEYLETSTLKPLRIRSRLDTAVVGWTVFLDGATSVPEAREKAAEYAQLFDSDDQKVMILQDINSSVEEMVVAWGIFASWTATETAVAALSVPLPPASFYIRMRPVTEN